MTPACHGQLSEELGFWFGSDEEKDKNTNLKRIKEFGQMLVRMGKKAGPGLAGERPSARRIRNGYP